MIPCNCALIHRRAAFALGYGGAKVVKQPFVTRAGGRTAWPRPPNNAAAPAAGRTPSRFTGRQAGGPFVRPISSLISWTLIWRTSGKA